MSDEIDTTNNESPFPSRDMQRLSGRYLSRAELERLAAELRQAPGDSIATWMTELLTMSQQIAANSEGHVFGHEGDSVVYGLPWRHLLDLGDNEPALFSIIKTYLADEIGRHDAREYDAFAVAGTTPSKRPAGHEVVRQVVTAVLEQIAGRLPLDHIAMNRFMTLAAQAFRDLIREAAQSEIGQLATNRKISADEVKTSGATDEREQFSWWFSIRHPRTTLARLDFLEGTLATDPVRSDLRRLHFLLFAFAGCEVEEIARFREYDAMATAKLRVDLDTVQDDLTKVKRREVGTV